MEIQPLIVIITTPVERYPQLCYCTHSLGIERIPEVIYCLSRVHVLNEQTS